MKARDQVMKMQLEWLRRECSTFSEEPHDYYDYSSIREALIANMTKTNLTSKKSFSVKSFSENLSKVLDDKKCNDQEKISTCQKKLTRHSRTLNKN